MELIIPFVSIIGVICGFLLSTIKEWIQNKPKIGMNMKSGKLNYYNDTRDELGQEISNLTDASNGKYYKVHIKLDVFNYGNGNTAIKYIDVENIVNKKSVIFSEVQLKKSGKQITSFNLPASSIETLDLEWRVDKDDNTEALFDYNKISLEKDRMQFKIIVWNIKDKKYKYLVEPLSIITAYD